MHGDVSKRSVVVVFVPACVNATVSLKGIKQFETKNQFWQS